MLLVLPVYMVLIGLLAGLAWIVASLHVFLRDTAQVLSVVLTLWFWLTPIMISEQQVPVRFRFPLLVWNPMSWVVGAIPRPSAFRSLAHVAELAVLAGYSRVVFASRAGCFSAT